MGSWDRLATNLTNQKWLLMIDSAPTWNCFFLLIKGQSDVQYEENKDIKMSEVANT